MTSATFLLILIGQRITLSERMMIRDSIGGDRLGEGELQNAKATFVDEDVSINANAITEGDGGKLIVFAEDSARIYGDLSARGGSVSDNGGFIETSGKKFFEMSKIA